MPENPPSAQPMETGVDDVQPPASGNCVQCAAADSTAWRSVANGAGQICFNCFEATAAATELLKSPTADASVAPTVAAGPVDAAPTAADAKKDGLETVAKEPEAIQAQPIDSLAAVDEVVANVADATDSAGKSMAEEVAKDAGKDAETASSSSSSSSSTATATGQEAAPVAAAAEPMEVQTEPTDAAEPAADEQQRRLRKSTRSTRYKSKLSTASTPAKPSSGSGATSSTAASATHHQQQSPSSSSAAAATANGQHNHQPQQSGAGSQNAGGSGGGGGNSSTPAASTSGGGGGGGKAAHPRGRSRRGAVFKKTVPQRAPTVTATTHCVQHVFHRGSYVQLGDIVSVLGHTEDTYYAQIRGLLVDSFCEKSAWLTWLLPTTQSPPPNERFEASTYVIGPDEERPRRLDCMQFVMHAPSAYYHSRTEPYPVPDGWVGDTGAISVTGGASRIGRVAADRKAGFIWTSLTEGDGEARAKRHRAAAEAATKAVAKAGV